MKHGAQKGRGLSGNGLSERIEYECAVDQGINTLE